MIEVVTQRWKERKDYYRAKGDSFHPSEFGVDPISGDRIAKDFVEKHHYSHSFPASRFRVGLYRKREGWFHSELVGVAVFSTPMSQSVLPKWAPDCLTTDDGTELGRFVLLDEVPYNAESWFLTRAVRALKVQYPKMKALISMSDPLPRVDENGTVVTPGHTGAIYQSINASYRGRASSRWHFQTPQGRFLSPRALSKIRGLEVGWEYACRDLMAHGAPHRRVGEEPAAWLERALREGPFKKVKHPGNHTYLWRLDGTKPPPSLPYPKQRDPMP